MWDSILLAYSDRSRVIPPDHRRLVTRNNGDVLPTLLVDGYVAGVWRPVEGGIEATAFQRLSDEAWTGLAAEAAGLVAFLADRDPAVYRRYAHWWTKLPAAEIRLLPGERQASRMEQRIEEAREAMGRRDWESLRPMLHPYLHWTDGPTRIRGRTKVMAHLRTHPDVRPPSSWELRDGQIYRWTM